MLEMGGRSSLDGFPTFLMCCWEEINLRHRISGHVLICTSSRHSPESETSTAPYTACPVSYRLSHRYKQGGLGIQAAHISKKIRVSKNMTDQLDNLISVKSTSIDFRREIAACAIDIFLQKKFKIFFLWF